MAKSLGRHKTYEAPAPWLTEADLRRLADHNHRATPTPLGTHDAAPALDLADQVIEEDEPRSLVRHTHIHLPVDWFARSAPRQPTHDAMAPRRGRDQGEPAAGSLLCKISQNGETGQWSGTDCDNRPLTILPASDGTMAPKIRTKSGSKLRSAGTPIPAVSAS
jgi:hypothetical protein